MTLTPWKYFQGLLSCNIVIKRFHQQKNFSRFIFCKPYSKCWSETKEKKGRNFLAWR